MCKKCCCVFAHCYTLDDELKRPMDYDLSLLPNVLFKEFWQRNVLFVRIPTLPLTVTVRISSQKISISVVVRVPCMVRQTPVIYLGGGGRIHFDKCISKHVLASRITQGVGILPYLGMVGRFSGDDPCFWDFQSNWVLILCLNLIWSDAQKISLFLSHLVSEILGPKHV